RAAIGWSARAAGARTSACITRTQDMSAKRASCCGSSAAKRPLTATSSSVRRRHRFHDGGAHMKRPFLAGLMMTGDELRGHVEDVLALPLSDSCTAALLARVNGAEGRQLLTAALAVAREQYDFRKADLRALAESEDAREHAEHAETELRELRESLKKLLG